MSPHKVGQKKGFIDWNKEKLQEKLGVLAQTDCGVCKLREQIEKQHKCHLKTKTYEFFYSTGSTGV